MGRILDPIRFVRRALRRIGHEITITRQAFVRSRNATGDIRTALPANLVISPGGVGTTFLMEHCARFLELNHPYDADGLKHVPKIPAEWALKSRILYISGDPQAVYASIERRGWVREQSAKLGSAGAMFTLGDVRRRFFIERVETQNARFRALEDQGLTLVIAYDDIWDRASDIAKWFAISDPEFLRTFPPRKPRNSVVRGGN